VKGGGGEEGERERERAREVRLHYLDIQVCVFITAVPNTFRLIRNAEALAATSPTLLSRPM
jgi:hypothetical protein